MIFTTDARCNSPDSPELLKNAQGIRKYVLKKVSVPAQGKDSIAKQRDRFETVAKRGISS